MLGAGFHGLKPRVQPKFAGLHDLLGRNSSVSLYKMLTISDMAYDRSGDTIAVSTPDLDRKREIKHNFIMENYKNLLIYRIWHNEPWKYKGLIGN